MKFGATGLGLAKGYKGFIFFFFLGLSEYYDIVWCVRVLKGAIGCG